MSTASRQSAILKQEKQILREQKKIERNQAKILSLSPKLKKTVKRTVKHKKKEEKIVEEEMTAVQKFFVNKFKKHKILFSLVVIIAGVLVWKGLWGIIDNTPFLSSAYLSLALGIFLLWLFHQITND